MSFEHAPVTKGLMVGCALSSILVGLFDVKHYFHLQFVPHLSRHHQYWRLGVHHLAFSNSTDLFIGELILYNVGVQIERQFGSVRYASYAVVTTLLVTILEFLAMILFHKVGLNHIAMGPSALLYSILYQYSRIVPSVYTFQIFGVPLNNKSFIYLIALQLAVSRLPASAAIAIIGVLAGQIYRSDLANLKSYRISPSIVRVSTRVLLPLIGSLRPPRRSNRALSDDTRIPTGRDDNSTRLQNDEVITTARTPAPSGDSARARDMDGVNEAGTGTSVVREWVDELTGRADRAQAGVRAPTEAEIIQITSIFPDVQRDVLVGALQRSPNIEGAVETLLSSQR